jgi:hypothetical protein
LRFKSSARFLLTEWLTNNSLNFIGGQLKIGVLGWKKIPEALERGSGAGPGNRQARTFAEKDQRLYRKQVFQHGYYIRIGFSGAGRGSEAHGTGQTLRPVM